MIKNDFKNCYFKYEIEKISGVKMVELLRDLYIISTNKYFLNLKSKKLNLLAL